MTLLLTMLPVYLLANIHCAGMCGPLVVFLGKHRFRHAYFIGRTLSFSLAGLLAGSLGALVNVTSKGFYLSVVLSFLIAGVMFLIGFQQILPLKVGNLSFLKVIHKTIAKLILQDRIWPTFLFGFCTVLLPCGQSLMVFSACALWGDPFIGWFNGLIFALLTTPSLLIAMQAQKLFKSKAKLAQGVMAIVLWITLRKLKFPTFNGKIC